MSRYSKFKLLLLSGAVCLGLALEFGLPDSHGTDYAVQQGHNTTELSAL
ncbi:MAG: hypothetical protein OIF47_06670 [Marinibacterium sp.]|nr:hypothetical protein [Marinibacterium sp.]